MKVIKASQLEVGNIIESVRGNPNIRGTVQQVHRFGCQVADRTASPSRAPANHKGKELSISGVESHVLRVRTPPCAAEARAAAAAVESCYDDKPATVAIKIGHQMISIAADTDVKVWVPAVLAWA